MATQPMILDIVTLFPEGIGALLNESIPRRAVASGAARIHLVPLRDFAVGRHATVDDRPLGGGPGMVLKPEPLAAALRSVRERDPEPAPHVMLTSPQGRTLTQSVAEELAARDRLTLICGHYKGVDQRFIDRHVDEEISIGDYVLSGGEFAAAVIVDAVLRLRPGVLGDIESAEGDSFSAGLLDHPHYTQPAEWEGVKAPEVLTSGHHARIDEWRRQQRIERTKNLRPDVFREWQDGDGAQDRRHPG